MLVDNLYIIYSIYIYYIVFIVYTYTGTAAKHKVCRIIIGINMCSLSI